MTVFDGVCKPLKRSAALMKWDFVGEVLIPGVLEEGEISKINGCQQAAALTHRF